MSKTSLYSRLLSKLGAAIANYLSKPVRQYTYFSLEDTATLQQHLQPGDILLVEGNERISTTIKYLTQSTWSHAAMYVGHYRNPVTGGLLHHQLIEADLVKGVISVPVEKYSQLNTRICQPVG
ncbi:MAG: lipo-like protein, partial [Piscirickettsiaceae bacterium]